VDFSLSDLSDMLLSWTVIYGPSMLFVALLLGAIGVPLPATFLVLAAGAFIRQGVLDPYGAIILALLGATLGDLLSYGMGCFARGPIIRRFGRAPAWQKAELNLRQRGGIAVYLTRWLLTPLAIPTNLVAGSTGYPFSRFGAYVLAGETTWLLLFGSLGYAFSSQWEALSEFISNFSGVLVGVAFLGLGGYFIFRRRKVADAPIGPVVPAEPEV